MTKSEYAKYLQTSHWRELRDAVCRRYDACVSCHLPRWVAEIAYGQDLHAHHKTYIRLGCENLDDLEPLCARCHEIKTFGRSELRAPKEAHCELCKGLHWDYRSPLCEFCLRTFCAPGGPSELVEILQRFIAEKPRLLEHIRSLVDHG